MECSFCKKEIKEKLGFKNVFSKKESFILCESCKKVLNINIEHLGEYTLYYFEDGRAQDIPCIISLIMNF